MGVYSPEVAAASDLVVEVHSEQVIVIPDDSRAISPEVLIVLPGNPQCERVLGDRPYHLDLAAVSPENPGGVEVVEDVPERRFVFLRRSERVRQVRLVMESEEIWGGVCPSLVAVYRLHDLGQPPVVDAGRDISPRDGCPLETLRLRVAINECSPRIVVCLLEHARNGVH